MKTKNSSNSIHLRTFAAAFGFALIISLAGCGNGASTTTQTNSDSLARDSATAQPVDEYGDWLTYEDVNVTMRYPGDWEPVNNLETGYNLVIDDPNSDEPTLVIKLTSVIHSDPGITLDKLAESEEKHIRSLKDSDPKILSSTRMEGYHELIYTLQVLPAEISSPSKYISYTWVKMGDQYDLRMLCAPDEFDSRYAIISKMARSFRWK